MLFSIDLKFDRLPHHSFRQIRLNACIGNRSDTMKDVHLVDHQMERRCYMPGKNYYQNRQKQLSWLNQIHDPQIMHLDPLRMVYERHQKISCRAINHQEED